MPTGEEPDHSDEWTCPMCTFVNPLANSKCEMCQTDKSQITEYQNSMAEEAARAQLMKAERNGLALEEEKASAGNASNRSR